MTSLSGVNVCLMGPSGTGKTYSLGTAVDWAAAHGVEVFFLDLENGLESLLGYYADRNKPIPANLHWHRLATPKASFAELQGTAEKILQYNLETLSKLQDPNKTKYDRFITLLKALTDFPDDRTGKKFGAVDSWGAGSMLIIDGLAGINNCAMSMVVGGKPVRSQPDWGIAQDQVEKILRQLTDGCECHFILLAHVEREIDAVLGGVKLMVSTLGKALAPKIPAIFSDVVLSVREGTKWTWDTASSQADTKTRNLKIANNLPADFGVLFESWRKRAEAMSKPAG
jgi:AAA domain